MASDTALISVTVFPDEAGHALTVATGLATGSGTITVTATDPGGLTGEFTLPVTIDDTGYTPYREIGVSNGVIGVFGLSLAVYVPPVVDQTAIDGFVYTIHSSKWQTRSDASATWTEVAGTERADGSFCPYTAEVPRDYRLVYEASIVPDPHLPSYRGMYASRNFFTVSDSE